MANNFTCDKFPRVRVLYSYEYKDEVDESEIYMVENEIFYLLNADENEWWQVCRPDSPEKHFYVPSTYVERLGDVTTNSTLPDHFPPPHVDNNTDRESYSSKTHGHTGENNKIGDNDKKGDMTSTNGPMDSDNSDDDYMNVPKKLAPGSDANSSIKVQYIGQTTRPSDLKLDDHETDDYVNLDKFRAEAGLPGLDNTSPGTFSSSKSPVESEYANLQQLEEELTPDVDKGDFVRALADNWELYNHVEIGRPFYVNKVSKKAQWKPPRGAFHKEIDKKKRNEVTSPGKSPDEAGDGGKPDFATIPEHGAHQSTHKRNPSSGSGKGGVSGHARPQVSRLEKSRSVMIENLHITGPPLGYGPPPPKSATLPTTFAPPPPQGSDHSLPFDGNSWSNTRQSSTDSTSNHCHSVNLNDPIEGTLNKCKVQNGKKAKKWTQTFVKLVGGSNLIFYKEQRLATPRKDAPYGKYEQIVSLATCSIGKDPHQYLTSKKHTFVLSNNEGHHIVLQADNEAQMQEWFVKLHTRIKELGGDPETQQAASGASTPTTELQKSNSFSSAHGSSSGNNTLERKGKIKNVLDHFLKARSDKKELVKRGIYKDAVFGADLKTICTKEKNKVPSFVERSIAAIEKRGLEHEGMYRLSGNMANIQTLRCSVDQGEAYDLNDPKYDVNLLCGALKLFFRELKDPLLTCGLFDELLKSFMKEQAVERLKAIRSTIEKLPRNHYESAKMLFKHLTRVMDNHKDNKMGAHQLAIVFGPTLIWSEGQTITLQTSLVYQSRIVEFILLEYKNIFR